jgi:leader peptidase (prepilin peptidase) / N-methyltransferase
VEQLVISGAALLGLLVGSFLNVVVYRVPSGMKVTRPPSACPRCGHPIRNRDNVPVVSWLILRGRCRDCGASISPRYPLVEAATALLFGLTGWLIGASWVLPAYLWFAGVTFALSLVDLDHRRIPNRILYPGTIVAVVLLGIGAVAEGEVEAMGRGLLGGVALFGFLLGLAVIARGGFGFGDVKLGFLLGVFAAYRSWSALVVGGFLAFLVGGVIAVLLVVVRRADRKAMIPFGPSLVAGCYVGIAAGSDLAHWYLG